MTSALGGVRGVVPVTPCAAPPAPGRVQQKLRGSPRNQPLPRTGVCARAVQQHVECSAACCARHMLAVGNLTSHGSGRQHTSDQPNGPIAPSPGTLSAIVRSHSRDAPIVVGQNLAADSLRNMPLSHALLLGVILPQDMSGLNLRDVDLRGSCVGARSSPVCFKSWPDLSTADVSNTLLDATQFVSTARVQGSEALATLLDCRATQPRSLLRCILSMTDPAARLRSVDTLLIPLHTEARPDVPWLDRLFGPVGQTPSPVRLEYALAMAEELGASGTHSPAMAWLRNEMACEVAQHAGHYDDTLLERVARQVFHPGFPRALHALAVLNHPGLVNTHAARIAAHSA